MQETRVQSLGREDALEKETGACGQAASVPLGHQGSPKWPTVAFILAHWAPKSGVKEEALLGSSLLVKANLKWFILSKKWRFLETSGDQVTPWLPRKGHSAPEILSGPGSQQAPQRLVRDCQTQAQCTEQGAGASKGAKGSRMWAP